MMRVRDLRVARGLDWGSASPGCVHWGAALPNEHVHIFDEYKFQRMTVREVAAGILAKDKTWGLKHVPTYADPALKANMGQIGESIGQTFARYGVPLIYPSNDRVNGWQRFHEALSPCTHPECRSKEYPNGRPWLTVHPRCKYLIRTIPLMVQSKNNPEDLDSDSDDHACDDVRYLLMGGLRPATGRKQTPQVEPYSLAWFRKQFKQEPRGVLA